MLRGVTILAIATAAFAQTTFEGLCNSQTLNPCFVRANCQATALSTQVTCGECPSGYQGNGSVCADINECATGNPCSTIPHSTCENLVGSFTCNCPSANFTTRYVQGQMVCDDIDECAMYGNDLCGAEATCENTIGGHVCRCNDPLFVMNPNTRRCTDYKDVCTFRNGAESPCVANQSCTSNGVGGATCSCLPGYRMNNNTQQCVDIDECATGTHQCLTGACTNTVGGYTCDCREGDGVVPDGSSKCANYNECLYVNDVCGRTECCRDLAPDAGKFECLPQLNRLRRLNAVSSLFGSSLFGVSSSELDSAHTPDENDSGVSSKKCPANSQTMTEWASQRRKESATNGSIISDETKLQFLNSFYTGSLDQGLADAFTNLTIGNTKISDINSPLFQYPMNVITNLASGLSGAGSMFSGWFGSY